MPRPSPAGRVAALGLLTLVLFTPAAHAHGCHHRGDHVHDDSLVRAWLADRHPDLDEAATQRLLGNPAVGRFFPAETELVVGPHCPLDQVTTPPGWFAGDSHVHVQGCPPVAPGASTPAELVDDMAVLGLDVVSGLLFGGGVAGPDAFTSQWLPLLTGSPDPASTAQQILQFGLEVSAFSGDLHGHPLALGIGPEQADIFGLRLGCEPLYDPLLHPAKVNWIDYYADLLAGNDPTEGVYLSDGSGARPAALLELFRQGPRAVTGWAHQMWPTTLYADVCDGGWLWESAEKPSYVGADIVCGDAFGEGLAFPPVFGEVDFLYPAFAPIDVALGLVDFLEALTLDSTLTVGGVPPFCPGPVDGPIQVSWSGLYDKLLDAGLRVSPSGGSDAPCTDGLICPPRTYVNTGGGLPDYDAWTAGLAAGRVSVASMGHQFLELQVSHLGKLIGPGQQLEVKSSQPVVRVQAVYSVVSDGGNDQQDVLELLVNGEVVAALPFGPLPAGEWQIAFPVPVLVPLQGSAWVAARTGLGTGGSPPSHPLGSTRTGAAWVIVDNQPLTACEPAEYFMLYCDFLRARIDAFEQAAAAGDPFDQVLLMALVGCDDDRAALREHIANGRKVFAAMRDHAHGEPPGVVRFGRSTYAPGQPPIALTVRRQAQPDGSELLTFAGFNAPDNQPLPGELPETRGWLVLAASASTSPTPIFGAGLYLNLDTPSLVLNCPVGPGGYVELTVPAPIDGSTLYAQLVIESKAHPSTSGPLTASDALAVLGLP